MFYDIEPSWSFISMKYYTRSHSAGVAFLRFIIRYVYTGRSTSLITKVHARESCGVNNLWRFYRAMLAQSAVMRE